MAAVKGCDIARSEETAGSFEDAFPMVIVYRFADTVAGTIRDFCGRALPGELLPARVEYCVCEDYVCDAYTDAIDCELEMRSGNVDLSFSIVQTAWRYEEQNHEELEPEVCNVQATRTVYDNEMGDEVELVWDDETGIWKRACRG